MLGLLGLLGVAPSPCVMPPVEETVFIKRLLRPGGGEGAPKLGTPVMPVMLANPAGVLADLLIPNYKSARVCVCVCVCA